MDVIERIAIAETKLKGFDRKCYQLETESSAMEKLVTEHTVHIEQQRKWADDHAKLHRDWNMKSWGILIAVVVGIVAQILISNA